MSSSVLALEQQTSSMAQPYKSKSRGVRLGLHAGTFCWSLTPNPPSRMLVVGHDWKINT